MKKILCLLFMVFNVSAGTGVGSPFIQQLPAFDYQMAFPAIWKVTNNDVTGQEGLFKRWSASNEPLVGQAKESYLTIEFLSNFPANSRQELFTLIKQRHPFFNFAISPNAQIDGWTSDLIQTNDIFENWEYYYIGPRQVVRIYTKRRKADFGLAHIGIILNSIRKISEGVVLKSVKFHNQTTGNSSVNIGDKVCYQFQFDYPKSLQSEDMISSFSLKYEKVSESLPINKGILKERSYNESTGEHLICYKIVAGMNGSLHKMREMNYELDGSFTSGVECVTQGDNISCGQRSFKVKVPNLNVANADAKGPELSQFSFNQNKNTLFLEVSDQNQIKLIQVFVKEPGDSEKKRAAIIYPDQIIGGKVNYKFRKSLSQTSYIHSVFMTDSAENTSVLLQAKDNDLKYSFKQLGQKIKPTKYNVVGW